MAVLKHRRASFLRNWPKPMRNKSRNWASKPSSATAPTMKNRSRLRHVKQWLEQAGVTGFHHQPLPRDVKTMSNAANSSDKPDIPSLPIAGCVRAAPSCGASAGRRKVHYIWQQRERAHGSWKQGCICCSLEFDNSCFLYTILKV